MNILVFSVSIGHGHNQVAKTLKDELEENGHTVQVIDALEFVSPFFSKVILESYLRMLRFTPGIYSRLYELADEPTFFDFTSVINNLLSSGFKKLVVQFKPDAIICTHTFPTGLLSALKTKLDIKIPIVAVMTDYAIHYLSIHPAVDLYITASPKLNYHLKFNSISEGKVAPTGIPIRKKFAKHHSKYMARENLGLVNLPTILMMGGGLGMGTPPELIRVVDHYLKQCQIIIIAGKNESLYNELRTSKFTNTVHVFGYVDNVEVHMAAADLLVTKPGGVTTSEALAMGLPMAFISPIPGQEWRNSAFLVEQLVAIQFEVATLAPKLADLLNDSLRLECMSKLAKQLAKPNSTHDAVELLERYLK
ncbi:MAG: glycosyltransferase [Bacillota bacterium]|nr:glycosyltransferase [Bacillota bacterium]